MRALPDIVPRTRDEVGCPGTRNHYKFVLGAGIKAKSVTDNLPLSMLAVVIFILCRVFS